MTSPDFSAHNQLTELLRARKDALTIRWLYAVGGTGLTAIVLAVVGETHAYQVPTALVALFWLASIVLAVLSVVLPRSRLGDKQLTAYLRQPAAPERWSARLRLSSEQTRVYLALPTTEQRMLALTLLFDRPYTLGLALASGIALVALAYGLLARTMIEPAPFLLAALAAQAWHYPRFTSLIDRGRKIEAAGDDDDARAMLAALRAGKSTAQVSDPPDGEKQPSQPPPPTPPPRRQPRFRKR